MTSPTFLARGGVVVTNEQPRPGSRNRILLPDVCDRFDVTYRDTFFLLRQLGIRLGWEAPAE